MTLSVCVASKRPTNGGVLGLDRRASHLSAPFTLRTVPLTPCGEEEVRVATSTILTPDVGRSICTLLFLGLEGARLISCKDSQQRSKQPLSLTR